MARNTVRDTKRPSNGSNDHDRPRTERQAAAAKAKGDALKANANRRWK